MTPPLELHLCDALYVHCAPETVRHKLLPISCICAMHFMFIVPATLHVLHTDHQVASVRCTLCSLCRSLWSAALSTIKLHLCDALYVHCATWRSVPCDAILRCICAMHFMFIVPIDALDLSGELVVASVRCTLCSLCLGFFAQLAESVLVASVRCTLCSLCLALSMKFMMKPFLLHLCDALYVHCAVWELAQEIAPNLLHLCDALYVHCADGTDFVCAHRYRCICAMHFLCGVTSESSINARKTQPSTLCPRRAMLFPPVQDRRQSAPDSWPYCDPA